MATPRRLASVLFCVAIFASATNGDGLNWPQWRGPNGDGATTASDVLTQWGRQKNVKWRVALPEAGNSSPIVWGEQIFLTQPITKAADSRMFLLTKSGTTNVFRADPGELKKLADNELEESSNASVVIAGDEVLIRTDEALWAFTK